MLLGAQKNGIGFFKNKMDACYKLRLGGEEKLHCFNMRLKKETLEEMKHEKDRRVAKEVRELREAGERNLEAMVEREIRDRVEREVRERVERELRDGAGREEGRRIRSRNGSGSRRKERSKRLLSTISEEDYSSGEPKTCQELAKFGKSNS